MVSCTYQFMILYLHVYHARAHGACKLKEDWTGSIFDS